MVSRILFFRNFPRQGDRLEADSILTHIFRQWYMMRNVLGHFRFIKADSIETVTSIYGDVYIPYQPEHFSRARSYYMAASFILAEIPY